MFRGNRVSKFCFQEEGFNVPLSRFFPKKMLSKNLIGSQNKWMVHFFAVLAITLASLPSFFWNSFGAAHQDFFTSWQQDSQLLVAQAIESKDGFGFWGLPGRNVQIGGQGHLFRLLSELGFSQITTLELFSSFLTALSIACLFVLVVKFGHPGLAITLLLVSVSSPWLVSAARNLYWIPWSWFLPAVISGLAFIAVNRKIQFALQCLLLVSFSIRFSAGYEFVSSIILTAALMPFLLTKDFFSQADNKEIFRRIRHFLATCLSGAVAFTLVIILHAGQRGMGSIIRGLEKIYREDVLRRTHGDPAAGYPNYDGGLDADIFGLLFQYTFGWTTPFLSLPPLAGGSLDFGPGALPILISACLSGLGLYLLIEKKVNPMLLFLFVGSLSIPASWYILAKGHSAIHLHINYVLWYPITAAVLIFLTFSVFSEIVKRLKRQSIESDLFRP
jgi:hypothetical protein